MSNGIRRCCVGEFASSVDCSAGKVSENFVGFKLMEALGFVAIACAVLLYGCYAVPIKAKCVRDKSPTAFVMHWYFACALFISSTILLVAVPFPTGGEVWGAGVVSAILWTVANLLSFVALQEVGMAISVCVWAGLSIVVNFVWGVVAFPGQRPIQRIGLAIGGLLLLLIGVIISALTGYEPKQLQKSRLLVGLLCAGGVGFLGGSIFVPFAFLGAEQDTVAFLIPFGWCGLLLALLLLACYCSMYGWPPMVWRIAPCILTSGFLWALGTICVVYAILFLGLALAVPLSQISIVVNGLLGMFLFGELEGRKRRMIFAGGILLVVTGAGLLANS